MTKKIFLAIAFVASVLVSCTDDYKDWADPQTVGQPETVSFGDGSISTVGVIDFNNVTDEVVKVCNITAPTSSDASFTPSYTITLGDQTFPISSDGVMSAEDLQNYVISVYGRRPEQRTVEATVNMWLSNGATTVKTATSNVFQINVIPEAPQISENYYIVGGPNDWAGSAASKELKFSHSGKDVYEDPIFTVVFNASEGDTWFAIGDDEACDAITNNNDWSKLFGTKKGNGNTDPTGNLDRRYNLSDDGSFCVPAGSGKFIRVEINMMDYTYTITPLNYNQFVYFIGATDGWSQAEQKLESAAMDGIYTGYVYCADPNGWGNEFKFQRVAGSWDNEINYGTFTGGVTGDFTEGGGGNFKAEAGVGVYYVTLNLATNTLNGVKITNMNLVGDFNGWNPGDDAQQMTWDPENFCYVITNAGVNSNGWKFTANNDWGINLGGNDSVEPSMVIDNLVGDGKNLGVVGKTIKLYPTRKTTDKIYCTVE